MNEMDHLRSLPQVTDVNYTPSEPPYRPERVLITFDNGYAASIIRGTYTYGGSAGLWEVAVVRDNVIVYDTPITTDVLGYMHAEELPDLLLQIAQLPSASSSSSHT